MADRRRRRSPRCRSRGYVVLFQGVYVRGGFRLDGASRATRSPWPALAATRVFAAGGAGGIALTAWALRRAGMPKRAVADQTLAFLVLTYGVYMAALVVGGFGLYFGILPGSRRLGDHAAAGDHRRSSRSRSRCWRR